jgi:hypothetical protein
MQIELAAILKMIAVYLLVMRHLLERVGLDCHP